MPSTAEDAYADAPPPKERFIRLYGHDALGSYLLERQATIAMPLLLVLHAYLDMVEKRGKTEVALTAAIWKSIGIFSEAKRARETILRHLHRLPELITLRRSQSFHFRYYVARGPEWRRMEEEAGKGKRARKGEGS
jgi:hypothetical protein